MCFLHLEHISSGISCISSVEQPYVTAAMNADGEGIYNL